jgi:tripartite-type tricarboxylate transporter receptor subunit TctC
MKRLVASCLILAGLAFSATASAHTTYPDKPIRIVVPFGAGSATDSLTRSIAKGLTERLGQSVVVDNRPGAGGNIGSDSVAKAEPDGYTLVMGTNGPFAANVSLYSKLSFDPAKDFEPIVLMGRLPMMLVASNSAPASSVPELIEQARGNSAPVNFGASNTTARVWVELLKDMAGIQTNTVLYKNVGSMVTDLISGQIPYAFENVGPSMPLVKSDKIKALAVTSPKRASFAPEIPTVAEAGLTRHELVVWFALFAPKGTPDEIVGRLNKEVNALLETDEIRQMSASIGMDPAGGSPKELRDYHLAEIEKWRGLVETTGVRLD